MLEIVPFSSVASKKAVSGSLKMKPPCRSSEAAKLKMRSTSKTKPSLGPPGMSIPSGFGGVRKRGRSNVCPPLALTSRRMNADTPLISKRKIGLISVGSFNEAVILPVVQHLVQITETGGDPIGRSPKSLEFLEAIVSIVG